MSTTWTPEYERWRHGGWYVMNVRYPSGAVGCVSRNYPDKKWRIVCDERPGERPTYANRDAAARAERDLVRDAFRALSTDDIERQISEYRGRFPAERQGSLDAFCDWLRQEHAAALAT